MSRAYAYRRPVENAVLVRERDRQLVHELAGLLVAIVVVGGGLLAYTWVHVEMLRAGYRIDELERELGSRLEEERRARLEVARAIHPARVEERARQELGMRPPTLAETLWYSELAPGTGDAAKATP